MGNLKAWFYLFFVTFLPAVELRGSIPLAIASYKLPVIPSTIVITIANILITPLVFLLYDLFIWISHKIPFLDRFVKNYLTNLQKRAQPYMDKYGFWGLMIFVAIPLPGTGAYSGSLAALIFGMNKMKAFVSISLGVILAGIIIALVTTGAVKLF